MSKEISYFRLTKFKECPADITGEAAVAWRSLASNGGVATIAHFDNDWDPIGPRLRGLFMLHGAMQSTSRGTTIIFLPEA